MAHVASAHQGILPAEGKASYSLRLAAGSGLLYTARVRCKGQVTMAEIVFSLRHRGRFLESEMLE